MGAFHPGEETLQRRAGSYARLAEIGPQVIRAAMPEQHRAFFAQLPFIALGALDARGQPWATLLDGAPGFVTAPAPDALHVAAQPAPDDPLAGRLQPGAPVGLLGIEWPTRRRNRANGFVRASGPEGFSVAVRQSFGNCPKYIQRRVPAGRAVPATAVPAAWDAPRLDRDAAARIAAADTFFIASHAPGDGPPAGVDVSHRGGLPGFVRVEQGGRALRWPDYPGNRFFNTLGNLAVEPRAGLVFPDFDGGGLLHLAGRAAIEDRGFDAAAWPGAERLLRFEIDAVRWRPAVSPLAWRLVERSPALDFGDD